jgi:hypothetical protein
MSIQGISPKQTINNYKDSESALIRKVIRNSWNNEYATGVVNSKKRAASEFKTIGNITDFLSRKNYACGYIPTPSQHFNIGSIIKNCDGSGVPCSNANTKFVPDSSEYIKYKRQRAFNRNYNDNSNGGDASNMGINRNF